MFQAFLRFCACCKKKEKETLVVCRYKGLTVKKGL